MSTAQDSQMLTQHRFTAEIENIGKPFSGGPGWDILLDWKLPGSNYNQHIGGQNWDDIEGFQVGQTHDWVINIGNKKRDKSGRYASDYFWDWDKTGNSTPPVMPEADQFFTGKPDTPSGPTGGNHQSPSASPYIKDELIVRQVAGYIAGGWVENQIIMPENFAEWLDHCYVTIMGYTQPSVTDNVSMPAMEVNEAPAAPAAPVVQEHHCEKHGVGFNKYNNNYMHKMGGTEDTYCHEGIEGLFEGATGNPVTE